MASKSFDLLSEAGLSSLPHEWDVVTIGQILSKDNGIAVGVMYPGNHDPSGIPLIRAGDLNGNKINPNPDFRISSEKHFEYRRTTLEGGELLLSLVGNLGQCAVVTESMIGWNAARAIAVIRLSDKSDTDFVRLCLMSRPLQYLMNAWATTTVQATLNLKEIKELPIPWPPKKEREAWVATIGALNNKIELNRRINQTLESIARAVFRQWFVENPKSNWGEKSLDEIADFLNGLALQKFPAEEGGDYLPVIKIAQLRKNDTSDADKASPNIPAEYIIEDGDILFSWSGSLEVVVWCGGRGALNQHLFKVTSKEYPKWFYYLWTKHHLPEFQGIAADKATTMGHIQRHHLSEAKVRIPSEKQLPEMNNVMSPILEQIINNEKESRTLASLRDSLLPKLMRGEVRVRQ